VLNPTEKQFYLRSFRHRAIFLHLAADYRLDDIRDVVDELHDNKTHLIVSGQHLGTRAIALGGAGGRHDRLARLSQAMVEQGVAFAERPTARTRVSGLSASIAAALDLRVRKLVVVDPRGGLRLKGGQRSFVNAAGMGRLLRDSARTAPWTKAELSRLVVAVKEGIGSVNLTDAPGLAEELFTYEGAGTLITADDYCQVRPLAADDFDEALTLLARGEREGFLLTRSAPERARLLLAGFGAWFEGGRLSGIAALETRDYKRNRLGEIVGLYTITKFQGEGVGIQIVDELLKVAKESKLRAVFACTRNDRAAEFFERSGFGEVSASRAPARKWKGRSRSGKRPRVFWRDL
jgi:amino-acid N-acetyltransferase